MENVRTVMFIGEQRGSGEDLFRCKETGKVYIRQECDNEYVRWLTSSKWYGGYEADCPMKEGLEIRISDKAGNTLFTEKIVKAVGYDWTVAKKEAQFSWEAISSIAFEVAREYGLRSYDEWEEWLLEDAKDAGFTGERDTWLYANVEYGKTEKIEKFAVLGKTVYAVKEGASHSVCGKRWTRYEIQSKDMMETLDLCGFTFEHN